MTRDDMLTVVDYYFRGASSKGVREDTDIEASAEEIEVFLENAVEYITDGIKLGSLDWRSR